MPRSFAQGDYSLVMAIESSSRPSSWYRVLADRQSGALSCDCPPWTFNRNQDEQGHRFCPHTRIAERLAGGSAGTGQPGASPMSALILLSATQEQWPGLHGTWSMEERNANIGTKPYHFVLQRLAMGNGGTATGVVAFAHAHHHTINEMIPGVAGWAGYAIAAEVARLGGFPLAGQPPEHFRIERRPSTRQRVTPSATSQPAPAAPSIGLADILRVGDIVQPGRDPRIVAEQTLSLFLGEELYAQLEHQGFLDVSSMRYADEQRVYRLRRDHYKERERRVRVFEKGRYCNDFCIVRDQTVPEADFWLTNWLMFLSDETIALSVVQPYNVFPPNSDGNERETVPAVWAPRPTAYVA
jgi:hypothetical protein